MASACSGLQDSGGPTPTDPATAKLLDFTTGSNNGIEIKSSSDVSKLAGVSDDFKNFIAGKIETLSAAEDVDDPCPSYMVIVKAFDPAGFAIGSELSPGCGGAAYMWARRAGVWEEIWGGQEMPSCSDMAKARVPKEIYAVFSKGISGGEQTGECYDGAFRSVEYSG